MWYENLYKGIVIAMMNDETTRAYEVYVKNILKIPYCNFSNTDNRIVSEIVYALTKLYKEYSFFDRVLCCIGEFKDVVDHLNLIHFSQTKYMGNNKIDVNEFQWNLAKYNNPGTWYFFTSMAYSNNGYYTFSDKLEDHYADYFSITISNATQKKDISNVTDISTTIIGRIAIYHEFGHLLDFFLHISNSEEFQKIIAGHNIEKEVSKLATKSNQELLAEAFSQYLYIKEKVMEPWGPNDLVNQIGELVNKRYKGFINNHSKDNYCFNKRFSISNTDVKDDCIKYPK